MSDRKLTAQEIVEFAIWTLTFVFLIVIMVCAILIHFKAAADETTPQPHLAARVTLQPLPPAYMGEYEIPGAYAAKYGQNLQARNDQ